MVRGASWNNNNPENLLSSNRNNNNPDNRNDNNGFRCVLVGESSRKAAKNRRDVRRHFFLPRQLPRGQPNPRPRAPRGKDKVAAVAGKPSLAESHGGLVIIVSKFTPTALSKKFSTTPPRSLINWR